MLETRIVNYRNGDNEKLGEVWKSGYFLSLDELYKLVIEYERDKQNDNMIGLDVHTKSYIENWLKTNKI